MLVASELNRVLLDRLMKYRLQHLTFSFPWKKKKKKEGSRRDYT
jgi:hypothetical protein